MAQAKLREKLSDIGILADIAQIDQEMSTDDEINELIMRTESELELWQVRIRPHTSACVSIRQHTRLMSSFFYAH
jgi:hypothetical protein